MTNKPPRRRLSARTALLCLPVAAWAQVTPPVSAGQLLEQQRRLDQQQAPSLQERSSPLREGASAADGASSSGPQLTPQRFKLVGNTLLSESVLQDVLRPWLGHPASTATLQTATAALEQAYREAGWLARVTPPRQDVSTGDLSFEITEAHTGHVRIAPASAGSGEPSSYMSERVLAMLNAQLPPGAPLNLNDLQRALLIAGELPGLTVAGSLQAGTDPGTTDVLLQVAIAPMLRGQVGIDNAANRITGSNRMNASLSLNSPWGVGEQIGLSTSVTQGTEYLRGFASMPIGLSGWRVGINASALRYRVLDESNTTTGEPPRGTSQTVGMDLQIPLLRSARAHWDVNLGTEQRRQANRDDVNTVGFTEPISAARSRTGHIGISGYAFDAFGGGGQIQAGAQIVAGRLNLDGSPDTALIGDIATVNTPGDYRVLRWNLSRLQAITPSLSLSAGTNGQFASRNLDSSEKLYLGGMGAVNAYPSSEAGGSNGVLVNIELRQRFGEHWQATCFWDWGQVRQYEKNSRADGGGDITASNDVALRGIGVSVSWRRDNGMHLRATWARRLGSNPLASAAGSDTDGSLHPNRIWLDAGIDF